MNPDLQQLHPYPFERLATLLDGVQAGPGDRISLSVGEPKHPAPDVVLKALTDNLRGLENYPPTRGSDAFRESMARWLTMRFSLATELDPSTQVIPVNGTREALFAIAQCLLDRQSNRRRVLMPNPFYQIYEGATYLAGLQPEFYDANATPENGPDFRAITDDTWAATQLLYICNPGNPTGSTLSEEELKLLVTLAAVSYTHLTLPTILLV